MKEPIPQEIIEDETPSWDEQERRSYQEMHEASMHGAPLKRVPLKSTSISGLKLKHAPCPCGMCDKHILMFSGNENEERVMLVTLEEAKLICAAPEMLRALQNIASTQLHLTFTCGNGGPSNPECVRCIAIDAIAKAGGDK